MEEFLQEATGVTGPLQLRKFNPYVTKEEVRSPTAARTSATSDDQTRRKQPGNSDVACYTVNFGLHLHDLISLHSTSGSKLPVGPQLPGPGRKRLCGTRLLSSPHVQTHPTTRAPLPGNRQVLGFLN